MKTEANARHPLPLSGNTLSSPEFRAALKTLGVSQAWLAARLGVDRITVWRWAKGDTPVPQYAIFTLELLSDMEEAVNRS